MTVNKLLMIFFTAKPAQDMLTLRLTAVGYKIVWSGDVIRDFDLRLRAGLARTLPIVHVTLHCMLVHCLRYVISSFTKIVLFHQKLLKCRPMVIINHGSPVKNFVINKEKIACKGKKNLFTDNDLVWNEAFQWV